MLKTWRRLRSQAPSPSGAASGKAAYSQAFYTAMSGMPDANSTTMLKAAFDLYRPQSFIDCGCGTGKWVATALQLGVSDSIGVDFVPRDQLSIPEAHFIERDLERGKLDLGRRFDLAICLEVAEHLSRERAPSFIEELCDLSDVVLFSAALPFQGGTWHINEQWLEYWGILFRKNGFVPVDLLRDELWINTDVHWYYRQNALFFCKGSVAGSIFPGKGTAEGTLLSRIHPEMFMAQLSKFWPHMHGPAYYEEIYHYHLLARAWLAGDAALPPQGHRHGALVHCADSISLADLDAAKDDRTLNNRAYLNLPVSVEGAELGDIVLRGA
ncbi:MAG: class I SAM-dependent methyltransferase [Acetobacteraceae bacterium]|nr:class I SAM-dependent methyltransferase [Acetobacteraceae bacterium]